MADDILETERLFLSRLALADIRECLVLDTDPSVMRYIGGPVNPVSRARWLENRVVEGWPARGGMWVARPKDGGLFLGWCGLFPIPLQSALYGPQLYEIGYRYLPMAWGRGLATEAARAVLDRGFRVLGHDPIVAVTHPANYASQRVLQKIGLRREGERVAYGHSLPFFSLGRRNYLRLAEARTGTAHTGVRR